MVLLHVLLLIVENAVGDKKGQSDVKTSEGNPAVIVTSENSNSLTQNSSINKDKTLDSEDSSSQGARDKAGALLASKMDYYKTVGECLSKTFLKTSVYHTISRSSHD